MRCYNRSQSAVLRSRKVFQVNPPVRWRVGQSVCLPGEDFVDEECE